jgi:hypothetical protein
MHIATTTTIALVVLHAGLSRAQIPLYKSYVGKQFTDDFCKRAEFCRALVGWALINCRLLHRHRPCKRCCKVCNPFIACLNASHSCPLSYVDQSTAQSESLVSWSTRLIILFPSAITDLLLADSTFTMKADSTQPSVMGKGRDSVRLVSNNDFGDGVYIFDINHMPVGCGTVRLSRTYFTLF